MGNIRMGLAFRFGLLLLLAGGTAPVAAAPTAGGCVPNSPLVSAERAISFLENPEALLNQFRDGQGGLASEIRDMLTIRPETLEGMATLAKASSADQSRAIGAGLGTAASVCVLTQPGFAQQIQEVVLKTENRSLIDAFAAITGDTPPDVVPGADANGDTSAGGGRGTTSDPRGGAVSNPSGGPIFSASGGSSSSTTTTFIAASVAGTAALRSVSPTN